MNLLLEFGRRAPNRVFISIVLGGLSGICYALLIPVVVAAVTTLDDGFTRVGPQVRTILSLEVASFGFASVFFALCLFILISRTLSRTILTRLSMEMTAELRKELCQRLSRAPCLSLEKLGPAKLTAVLIDDVRRIVFGGQLLPDLLINMITLVGMLGFLVYLNSDAFIFVMEAIVFGVLTYQVPVYFGRRAMLRSRQLLDGLQEALRGLVYGFKELKLDAGKRDRYFEQVLFVRERQLLQSEKQAYTTFVAAASYGDLLSFFVIGVVAFVFINYHAVESNELIGIVMALLYVTGPISFLMNVLPQLAVAKSSLRNVEKLLDNMVAEPAGEPGTVLPTWQKIMLSGVSFQHGSVDGAGFVVGPLDCEIERGKITFIVGGNGSGKSTLSKIISLYYPPSQGSIRFGQRLVTDDNRNELRRAIGAIFSDYYLFDRLLIELDAAKRQQAQQYLVELGLSEKVSIDAQGIFSTLALSDGQRKRLALLVALLDDKQLYLFDEWAADQDPPFKEIFYRKMLPMLKAAGKAIVVISHDDRYFGVADRIFRMERGCLSELRRRELPEERLEGELV